MCVCLCLCVSTALYMDAALLADTANRRHTSRDRPVSGPGSSFPKDKQRRKTTYAVSEISYSIPFSIEFGFGRFFISICIQPHPSSRFKHSKEEQGSFA